jgi:uncharacterized short protein YbdD (DUF466 family)
MKMFDILIPVGPADISICQDQLEYTKKNIIGYRSIFLVSCDPSLQVEGCTTIPEDIFPFTMKTIEEIHGKHARNGWYLQQLLKLYAGMIIPGILERYLVIDCDTFFLKPTTFIKADVPLYNYSEEYYSAYFKHMKCLHPSLKRVNRKMSAVCHHMMFETTHVKALFRLIENGIPFYRLFLEHVTDAGGSGASEYEIYFNYMLLHNPSKIRVRALKWANVSSITDNLDKNYDYVSCHCHMRALPLKN